MTKNRLGQDLRAHGHLRDSENLCPGARLTRLPLPGGAPPCAPVTAAPEVYRGTALRDTPLRDVGGEAEALATPRLRPDPRPKQSRRGCPEALLLGAREAEVSSGGISAS